MGERFNYVHRSAVPQARLAEFWNAIVFFISVSLLVFSQVAGGMSDKLQFVDASMESGFAADDKLKFIGHKAPSQ